MIGCDELKYAELAVTFKTKICERLHYQKSTNDAPILFNISKSERTAFGIELDTLP